MAKRRPHVDLWPRRAPPRPHRRRRKVHPGHPGRLPRDGGVHRPHGGGRRGGAQRAAQRALRPRHQRPEDAAHGRHRAARRDRHGGPQRPHRHHDRLRHRRDGDRRDEARRLRLHPQALQGRGGHPRRAARPREAAPRGGEPAPARGGLALQGERGDRGEPLARRGARDDRRHGRLRAERRPGLHVARGRRGRLLRAAAHRPASRSRLVAAGRRAPRIPTPSSRDAASTRRVDEGSSTARGRRRRRARRAGAARVHRPLRGALDAARAGHQGRALLRQAAGDRRPCRSSRCRCG